MSPEADRLILVAKDDSRREVLARIARAFIEQPTLRLTELQANACGISTPTRAACSCRS